MDGRQKRIENSLQRQLSLWLSVAILGIAIVAGAFAFFSALNEAHELQDDTLRQVATLFDRHHLALPEKGNVGKDSDDDAELRVYVQPYSTSPAANGLSADALLALPGGLADGLDTVRAGGETYRVLIRTLNTGERLAVAQETALRDETALNSALRTLAPFLILVPILMLVVAGLIRRLFEPVAALASEIDRRGEQELQPIPPEPLPKEIRPFVGAINRLFGRVEQSMETQRRFVADAAHELRSPLTAMSLQAERLAESEMSVQASERLHTLRQGIERGRSLLDQLLTLARAQAVATSTSTVVSLQQVFRRVLEDLLPLAEAKQIDVGMTTDADLLVQASEVDLVTLVRNLVDNAIRYTQAGGRVDLSIQTAGGVTTVRIEDNGPGIPEAEQVRVFDPFHRVLGNDAIGSGLGLSIVKTISARIGAEVSLDFTDPQAKTGLCVSVLLKPFLQEGH